MNRIFALLIILIAAWSCKNDDDSTTGIVVPPRFLSEVAIEDDAELQAYFQTHFYNYEEFQTPPINFDFKIKFDTIAGDNSDKTPLSNNQVQMQKITVPSSFYGREDGEIVEHTLYYLEARVGSGASPTIADNVVLQYEGSLLDGTLFDASSTPLNQYLSGGLILGYSNGAEKFSAGTGPFENGDGTVSFDDFGIGAVFMPSGLGYFSSSPNTTIPAYAPLIFKLDILAFEEDTDFDNDGIPSIQEDLDGDGNLNNDNTDQDSEQLLGVFFPNHNDPDDDGDGILTIDEIEIDTEGNITFPDSDGDGIVDYLDSDS